MATERSEQKNVFWLSEAPKPATDPEQFRLFHELTTKNDPNEDYWYLPLGRGEVVIQKRKTKEGKVESVATISGKDPLVYGKWKDETHRLTFEQAYKRLKEGFNVGVAAKEKDHNVILDVDNMDMVGETKPTLQAISRKRQGRHNFYKTKETARGEDNPYEITAKDNIALDDAGELRSNWQYVVAPGSFVPCGPVEYNNIPEEDRCNAGKYSLLNPIKPANITFDELPEIFKNKRIRDIQAAIEKEQQKLQKQKHDDRHSNSRLFELTAGDVLGYTYPDYEKFPSPLHGSSTGANASFTGPLLHCWRHNVSHSGYSLIAAMAELYECGEAGTPHKKAGCSYLKYDGEEIFKVWKYAKEHNHIPEDDSIPTKALVYYATSNGYCKESDVVDGWKLPTGIYNLTLGALTDSGINSGRAPLEIPQKEGIPNTETEGLETISYADIQKQKEKLLDNKMNMALPEDHFITIFTNWQKSLTDAYPEYHFMGGMWLLSAFCQGKVVLKLKMGTTKPNNFIHLIGPTTISHKTTSINNTKSVYESVTGEILYNDDYSLEGLLELLSKKPASNFVRDESAGLLAKMHTRYNDGIFDLECNLYSGGNVQKTLANKKGQEHTVTVTNPYITKLYATTPEKFINQIQQIDFDCGWGYRFLYCWPKYKKERMGLAKKTQEDIDAWAEVLARGRKIYKDIQSHDGDIEFDIEHAALEYLDTVVEHYEKTAWDINNAAFDAAVGRGQEYCLKLAMLFEIGKRTPNYTVTVETMKYAAELVFDYFIPTTMEICERIQEDVRNNQIEKIISKLREMGGVGDHSVLLNKTKILAKLFNECISTMVESGVIKIVQVEETKKKTYILQSDNKPWRKGDGKKSIHQIHQIHQFPVLSHVEQSAEKKVNLTTGDTVRAPREFLDSSREYGETVNLVNSVNLKDRDSSIPCGKNEKPLDSGSGFLPNNESSEQTEKDSIENMQLSEKIEESLDIWEKHSGSPIFSKNKHKAVLDIMKFHKMSGINPTLISEAVDRRALGRCVDCGSENTPHETKGEGMRCNDCHRIYSNPPAVKVPDEISLEPVEVTP